MFSFALCDDDELFVGELKKAVEAIFLMDTMKQGVIN